MASAAVAAAPSTDDRHRAAVPARAAVASGVAASLGADSGGDRGRRRGLRVPAEAEHVDGDRPAPEVQRLVAVPHVDVDFAALHRRPGVHHRVDAVVAGAERVDLDDRPDRQEQGVGGGDAGADGGARGGRGALAVGGGVEAQPGTGTRPGRRLTHLDLVGGRGLGVQRRHLVEEDEAEHRSARGGELPRQRA